MSQDSGVERASSDPTGDPDELVGPGDERRQAAEAEQRLVAEGDPQEEPSVNDG
jgi:hypothetical protein